MLMRFTVLLLLVLPLTLLSGVNGQAGNQAAFVRAPANYNPQTGAFTLNKQGYDGFYDRLCLTYDYFVFNADGGRAVSWQVNSPGQVIYYAIINSDQYPLFDAYAQNCYLNLNSPSPYFNSKTTLNWTPPGNGQYALIFFTRIYYAGPIYLTQ